MIRPIHNFLSQNFVGRGEEVELVLKTLIAKQHAVLFSEPGTGKSAIISLLCKSLSVPYFSYLLTKFSKYSEVFGSVNVKELRESGVQKYITDGKLPQAKVAFVDETFKGSSAILNSLLEILNEREFLNGTVKQKVPLWSCFGASNEGPDEGLEALYDRFLYRTWLRPLSSDMWDAYLDDYWKLHIPNFNKNLEKFDFCVFENLHAKVWEVDWTRVKVKFLEVLKKAQDHGVTISDRRKGRGLIVISTSAVFKGSNVADLEDLFDLRYVLPNTEDDLKVVEQVLVDVVGRRKKLVQEIENLLPQVENISKEVDSTDDLTQLVELIKRLKTVRGKIDNARRELRGDESANKVIDELTALVGEINEKITEKVSI